ncbi:hypothetical protein JW824_04170 [bacterium]|nr:hypothetical protein [bacterium]
MHCFKHAINLSGEEYSSRSNVEHWNEKEKVTDHFADIEKMVATRSRLVAVLLGVKKIKMNCKLEFFLALSRLFYYL